MIARLFLVAALAFGCKKELADEPGAKPDPVEKKKQSLDACPKRFADVDETCSCEEDRFGGAVWGTDVFTEDSSPCAAALHVGVIKKSGGAIKVKRGKGCDAFLGSTKNGVASHGFGKASKSYYFPDKSEGKCKKPEACPATFKDKDLEAELTCACESKPTGAVFGTDIYTRDSSICSAAVHDGVIAHEDGGIVTLRAAPGCKSYAGSARNGVSSGAWGEYELSFYFPDKSDGICKAPKVVAASTYAVGDKVSIEWNGSWWPGAIIAVAGTRYRVHYDGYDASWDEWVTPARLKKK